MKLTATLFNAQQGHTELMRIWHSAKAMLIAGHRMSLTLAKQTRSVEQNAMLWSVLGDIASQVEWHVDGRAQKLSGEDWKDILSAGLAKHQRVAAGIEGGFVMLGQRTSKMTIADMSELITLGHAFGDERGVKWSRTSLGRDFPDEYFEDAA